jgi:hypothetical protein
MIMNSIHSIYIHVYLIDDLGISVFLKLYLIVSESIL